MLSKVSEEVSFTSQFEASTDLSRSFTYLFAVAPSTHASRSRMPNNFSRGDCDDGDDGDDGDVDETVCMSSPTSLVSAAVLLLLRVLLPYSLPVKGKERSAASPREAAAAPAVHAPEPSRWHGRPRRDRIKEARDAVDALFILSRTFFSRALVNHGQTIFCSISLPLDAVHPIRRRRHR